MTENEIAQKLRALETAARKQANKRYDHTKALNAAGIKERDEDLRQVASAWASELPNGRRTLIDYENLDEPSGDDMARVFERAADRREA